MHGRSLLESAALCGSEIVTRRCLDLGVDVHVHGYEEKTALHIAATCGHLVVVKMLVQAGSDIHATDRHGMTALACANNEVSDLGIPWNMQEKRRRTHCRDVIETDSWRIRRTQ
jgi:hypothetical protein